MLAGQDQALETGVLQHPNPLIGIQVRRVEELRGFGAVSPFPVGEGVHAEMDKGGQFQPLPSELAGRRRHPGRLTQEVTGRLSRPDALKALRIALFHDRYTPISFLTRICRS